MLLPSRTRYNRSRTKIKNTKREIELRIIFDIFKKSERLKEGDDNAMNVIASFVFACEHDGAHDMIAKIHELGEVAIGRVVVQWCPGNEKASVVMCNCRSMAKTLKWKPLLRLVVIVPKTNYLGQGDVLYDRSNLCFLNF